MFLVVCSNGGVYGDVQDYVNLEVMQLMQLMQVDEA